MSKLKTLFLLTLMSVLIGGCASQGSDEAANAASAAVRAQSNAEQAIDAAEEAQSVAEEALDAVRRLEEKVDRMFEKALQK